MAEVGPDDLWRGQLGLELQALAAVNVIFVELETKLDALAEADARCQRLMTIPGVGPRLAEAVAATLDRPDRFRNGRQVGVAGLTPRRYQAGQSDPHPRAHRPA